MVAPLVAAGSTRVTTAQVAKPRNTQRNRSTQRTKSDRSAIARNRTLRQKNGTTDKQALALGRIADKGMLAPALPTKVLGTELSDIMKNARVTRRVSRVALPILSVYWWAYAFQFLMALFFCFAAGAGMLIEHLAAESWAATFAKFILNLLPTGILLGSGWIIASGIGLGFLFATALAMYGARVKNPWTWRTFVVCASLQAAPFMFILPWPAIWIGAVLYLETFNRDSHS